MIILANEYNILFVTRNNQRRQNNGRREAETLATVPITPYMTWNDVDPASFPVAWYEMAHTKLPKNIENSREANLLGQIIRVYINEGHLPLVEPVSGVRIYPNSIAPNIVLVQLDPRYEECSQDCIYPTPWTRDLAQHYLHTNICRRHPVSLRYESWVYIADNNEACIVKLFTDEKLCQFIKSIRRMLVSPRVTHRLVGAQIECGYGRSCLNVRVSIICRGQARVYKRSNTYDITDPAIWHPQMREWLHEYVEFRQNATQR